MIGCFKKRNALKPMALWLLHGDCVCCVCITVYLQYEVPFVSKLYLKIKDGLFKTDNRVFIIYPGYLLNDLGI